MQPKEGIYDYTIYDDLFSLILFLFHIQLIKILRKKLSDGVFVPFSFSCFALRTYFSVMTAFFGLHLLDYFLFSAVMSFYFGFSSFFFF